MGRLWRGTFLMVVALLMLAGVCFGKQVYLRNGEIVDCQSAWRRGDAVVVKINRDIMVQFQSSEVDMRKTFPAAAKRSVRVSPQKTGVAVPPQKAAPVANKDAASPSVPVVKPEHSPAPPAAPAAKAPVAVEPARTTSGDASPPPDKAERERRSKQAAEMMVEAIQKKDPELMKKAVELQKSTMPQNAPQPPPPAAMSLRFLLILLIVSLLIVVSTWVVFEKAGHSGWKSMIPIYNVYILLVISGKPGWWLILLLIPFVGTVFYLLAMLDLAKNFGRSALFGVGLCFLPMIFFPLLAFGGSGH